MTDVPGYIEVSPVTADKLVAFGVSVISGPGDHQWAPLWTACVWPAVLYIADGSDASKDVDALFAMVLADEDLRNAVWSAALLDRSDIMPAVNLVVAAWQTRGARA